MEMRLTVVALAALTITAPAMAADNSAIIYAQTQQGRNLLASADYYLNTLCSEQYRLSKEGERLIKAAKSSNPQMYKAMWATEAKGPLTQKDCATIVDHYYGPQGSDAKRFGSTLAIKYRNYGSDPKDFAPSIRGEICADVDEACE